MTENLLLFSSSANIAKKFNIENIETKMPIQNKLISGGDQAWIVSSAGSEFLIRMNFGFTPEYAPKRLAMLNLRTDQFQNEHDVTEYDRLHDFFNRNGYSRQLVHSRCLVFVDAFLVTSPDNSIYLIHLQNEERPIALAGIHNNWLNFETNKYETGFTLITVAANPMLKSIGIETMPVIITLKNVPIWLDNKEDRRKVLALIHTYPDATMNYYPVSGKIFSTPFNKDYLQPIGTRCKPL